MSENETGHPEGMATPPPFVLVEAEAAFERGDWREARRIAKAQFEAPQSVTERNAAHKFLGRFDADPLLVLLYAGGVITLLLLALHYMR